MRLKFNLCSLIAAVLGVGLFASCGHLGHDKSRSQVDATPAMFKPWENPPGLQVEDALAKTMVYLREQQQDLSKGYVLEATRGTNCWWFEFKLLPRSPDFEITVRVFDSGKVVAGPLEPHKTQAVMPTGSN